MTNTTNTTGITVTTNQLIGFGMAALLGFMTFKDDVFKGDQSQTVAITQLTLQIENLSDSVKRLEDFSRAPRFTQENFNFEMRERDSNVAFNAESIFDLQKDFETLEEKERELDFMDTDLVRRVKDLELKNSD